MGDRAGRTLHRRRPGLARRQLTLFARDERPRICPRIINSWIDNNLEQLKSKTLVPFATSGSSGIEDAVAYLRKTYPELKWEKGKLMNN